MIVRIERRWTFVEVRRAALALAREVERRAPRLATSKWWKEERHGVFVDYNQNAKDRTVASAYSVRPKPDARVSAPVTWEELESCRPEDFTLRTMPARFARLGDRHAGIDAQPCSLDRAARALARRRRPTVSATPRGRRTTQKQAGEPPRVAAVARADGRRRDGVRPPSEHEAAHRDRPRTEEGGRPRRVRALEDAPPRRGIAPRAADVLVDAMRGRFTTWTRIRVNLEHVPAALRPAQEPLDPADEPGHGGPISPGGVVRRRSSPARTRA